MNLDPTSISRLSTCQAQLNVLFSEISNHRRCKVICGHRGEEEQNKAYGAGRSKLKYPKSKHNPFPAEAADVVPLNEKDEIDWNDLELFKSFGFFVLGFAAALGIPIRWGADWDKDYRTNDEKFLDLSHFELIKNEAH